LEIHQKITHKPGQVRCPKCRSLDIVPSMPRGVVDIFMEAQRRVPRHCRKCGKRFYTQKKDGSELPS
jgi:DNA-directed RNA polymerase subunit RPC12/RpoP